MSLAEKINKAKAEHPKGQSKPIPENSAKVDGYWEKDNKAESSWVGKITGHKPVEKNGKHYHELTFDLLDSHSIEWTSNKEKNEVPAGVRTWYLTEGLYKARIIEAKGSKEKWELFAVVNGEIEDLTEAQAVAILDDNS